MYLRPPHHEHHNSESPNEGRLPDAVSPIKSLKMQHEPCSVTSGTKCDGFVKKVSVGNSGNELDQAE
ncbi:hypothetical protein Tco_1097723 [Tanacetum coccineum]